jgi:hypothetical protein
MANGRDEHARIVRPRQTASDTEHVRVGGTERLQDGEGTPGTGVGLSNLKCEQSTPQVLELVVGNVFAVIEKGSHPVWVNWLCGSSRGQRRHPLPDYGINVFLSTTLLGKDTIAGATEQIVCLNLRVRGYDQSLALRDSLPLNPGWFVQYTYS